jgi:hypothetical protein
MKTNNIESGKYLIAFSLFCLLQACDSRYQGNKDTQIDSTEFKSGAYDIDRNNQQQGQETLTNAPVSTNNAVKINVPVNEEFWKNFRTKYHVAIREGDVADIAKDWAMGPWLKWTDQISYQYNYRFFDNQLWVQTFYREENYEQAATPQGNRKLLTIDLPDSLGLSNLWHQMDELARHIEDSVLNRSRRTR